MLGFILVMVYFVGLFVTASIMFYREKANSREEAVALALAVMFWPITAMGCLCGLVVRVIVRRLFRA